MGVFLAHARETYGPTPLTSLRKSPKSIEFLILKTHRIKDFFTSFTLKVAVFYKFWPQLAKPHVFFLKLVISRRFEKRQCFYLGYRMAKNTAWFHTYFPLPHRGFLIACTYNLFTKDKTMKTVFFSCP